MEINAKGNGVFKGGDGKSYFVNAKQMMNYLSKKWGSPILLKSNETINNAVVYQTGFSGGVSGHMDVYYKGNVANHFYDTKTY
jgi:hypothetical protein